MCACMTCLLRLQLWKKYLPNTKVSFLEYDAACANKHKVNIEAQSKGTLFIGELMPHSSAAISGATMLSTWGAPFGAGSHLRHQRRIELSLAVPGR